MNLINTLEMQILITKNAEMQRQMRELQRKISRELAQRFVKQIEADDLVLDELDQLVRTNGNAGLSSSLPMPIVISSYGDSYNPYR
jgi:hypothetical protein